MGLLETSLGLLEGVPPALVVMLLAWSPLGEVRVSVPVAMLFYDMGWGQAIVWSLIGNLMVAPVAAWLYPRLENLLRRSPRGDRIMARITARTRKQVTRRTQRIEEAAITGFIALPLPGSGAWSGVLVAHLFGLEWRKVWPSFYAGVVLATFLVTFLVATGRWFL